MIGDRTSFRFLLLLILILSGMILAGCGGDSSGDDADPVEDAPAGDADANGDGNIAAGTRRIGDVIPGETLTGTADAAGELVSILIGTPEGGLVTVHLSGAELEALSFYLGGTFPTAPIRVGDASPAQVDIAEVEGGYTVVYEVDTVEGFFFSFRASGDYTLTVEAGNTLPIDPQ